MNPFVVRQLIDVVIRHAQREQAKEDARRMVTGLLKSLRVKVDISSAGSYLKDVQRRVNYAKAIALTKTAKRIQQMAEKRVAEVFDRPTRFITKGFYVRPATVAQPEAIVAIKDRQAKVLLPHIVGGRRDIKPFEQRLPSDNAKAAGFWVPGEGIKLNQSGNLTRAQIKQIVAGLQKAGRFGEVFVGKPRGIPGAPYGIWSRPSKRKGGVQPGLVPLLIRIEQPSYAKRFDFIELAERNAQAIFNEEFNRAFRA